MNEGTTFKSFKKFKPFKPIKPPPLSSPASRGRMKEGGLNVAQRLNGLNCFGMTEEL
jgi:hypothetical protein